MDVRRRLFESFVVAETWKDVVESSMENLFFCLDLNRPGRHGESSMCFIPFFTSSWKQNVFHKLLLRFRNLHQIVLLKDGMSSAFV